MALIGARKEDPASLTFTYGSISKLEKGVKTDAEMANPDPDAGAFKMTLDEPTTMPGGTNAGPNPLDLLCASLGTCQEITYKLYATVMDVPLNSVSAKVTGNIDLRGFVGLIPKAGFEKLDVEITLDAPDATDAALDQLKAAVDAHCPLVASLSQPLELDTELVCVEGGKDSDADTLKEGVVGVVSAGKEDEAALRAVYTSSSKLSGAGLKSEVTLPGGHSFVVDEPTSMPGGTNEGPNPLDLFCAALGTCQEITYKYYAAVLGVKCDSISCKVKAPIDLGGLVGLADDAVGLKSVQCTVTLSTDASPEEVEKLKGAVDACCPLADTFKAATPVALTWRRPKAGVASAA